MGSVAAALRERGYKVTGSDERVYPPMSDFLRSKGVELTEPYRAELLIVNNIEFDHADIFPDLAAVKLSFRRLLNIVPQNGMILLNGDDANCVEVARDCLAPIVEVGFSENCAERIRDVAYGPD